VALEFDDLTKNAVVTERLTCSFEFRVVTGQHPSAWYVIDGVDRIHVLVRDGSGGEYVIVQPSEHAACISSEGQAGTIAADLDELIALVIASPYWLDILRYSEGGKRTAMRRAASIVEDVALDDEPGFREDRRILWSNLGLQERRDLVAALHRTVTSPDCRSRPPRWQSRSKLHRLVQYRAQSNVWRIEGLIQFCSAATAR
jgi:hypothetical protein